MREWRKSIRVWCSISFFHLTERIPSRTKDEIEVGGEFGGVEVGDLVFLVGVVGGFENEVGEEPVLASGAGERVLVDAPGVSVRGFGLTDDAVLSVGENQPVVAG